MKSYIALMAFVFLAAGCAGPEVTDPTDVFDGGSSPDGTVNETNYASCANFPPLNQDINNKRWYLKKSRDERRTETIMKVANGYIEMTNRCSERGMSVTAKVSARATADAGMIYIYSSIEKTEKSSFNGIELECKASIKQANLKYAFKGECLELIRTGTNEKIVMIPN